MTGDSAGCVTVTAGRVVTVFRRPYVGGTIWRGTRSRGAEGGLGGLSGGVGPP